MRLYKILENGYQVGQARGMSKAIRHVKIELEHEGIAHLAKWTTLAGVVKCTVPGGIYEISRDSSET